MGSDKLSQFKSLIGNPLENNSKGSKITTIFTTKYSNIKNKPPNVGYLFSCCKQKYAVIAD
jgi:hypothetical protein